MRLGQADGGGGGAGAPNYRTTIGRCLDCWTSNPPDQHAYEVVHVCEEGDEHVRLAISSSIIGGMTLRIN